MKKKLMLMLVAAFSTVAVFAQEPEAEPERKDQSIQRFEEWFGMYTQYRLSERWSWYAEYHYRRRDLLQQMGVVYLRLAASYLVSNQLEFVGGYVNPYYWAPDPSRPNIDLIVPDRRLWQQALFVSSFPGVRIYHRLRTEQRWRRDFEKGAPWHLFWRFRYQFTAYVPLNRPALGPKTLFLAANEEIFIQAGRKVVFNHFEDNRVFAGLGYVINPNFQVQGGYMWTFRHVGSPYRYEHRHIFKLNFYHSIDFYSKRQQRQRTITPPMMLMEF